MSLLKRLKEKADPLSPSSKFTVLNGVLYMSIGVLFLIWPGALQTLTFAREFVGDEGDLIRIIGLTLAIIGWFYFFGGRSGGKQIVAASVLDRVILVPLVLIPLAISGVFPVLLWTFAVLDPVLGLVAWYLLVKENRP
jgi:hypothetical protein